MPHTRMIDSKKKLNLVYLSAFSLGLCLLSSCEKSDTHEAKKFGGTYTGAWSCGGTTTITLDAADPGTYVGKTADIGAGACVKNVTINCTAGGNTITIWSQSFTDNCGAVYTVTGSASLDGDSSLRFTQVIAGPTSTETCTFTGKK
jgi:hypothetical protein